MDLGKNNMLSGVGASQGYGIGKAVIIHEASLDYSSVKFTNAENEKARLKNAIQKYIEKTKNITSNMKENSEILEGHISMLSDPFMLSEMEREINNGSVAERGVDLALNMFIDMFSSVDDELTRQRASDIKDIKDNLLKILLGINETNIENAPKGSILVAKDFTPSMTSQIKSENVSAIITEIGGITSHSAILARSMGIPAVLSVMGATKKIENGEMLIADGFKGKIIQSPTKNELEEFEKKQKAYLKEKESVLDYFGKPTITKKGEVKKLYGNIGKAEDAQNVIQNGGEGIGLFRTEFLFMDRDSDPTEQEQFEAYSTVAKAMNGREVIIRTLDVGGDKDIPYLKIDKEENPFLGHRAIRYCLDNPRLYKKQLRAILRASQFGDVKIMLPLVTTLDEVRRAKALIKECEEELQSEGITYNSAPLGVMIETPSASIISDQLAKEVEFFSIGTNDLTAYTMAVDRGNAKVAHLYDPMQESVLRSIEQVIKNAKAEGIMVGMCGEAAADERLIPLLLKWGLDEFSVTPSAILKTRKQIFDAEY